MNDNKMNQPENIAERVKSKEDFLEFMNALNADLKDNPESWHNRNLGDYLEAIQRWVEDMEGYYENNDISIPENLTWKVFADILVAAKMYE